MLGERIRNLRKKLGYSQQQLAKKMHLTQGAISQWENDLTEPAADQLTSLASIFGISVDDLLEIEKQETASTKYDSEVMAIRDRYRRDPYYRLLFDAAENAKPEHLKAAAAMLKSLEGTENVD